jgi:methylenetetrahydrofolate dehydrogenase (NADP+)/methenyltetrahydrofolate cyclohydrolase
VGEALEVASREADVVDAIGGEHRPIFVMAAAIGSLRRRMAATVIDGKAVAARVRAEVGESVAEYTAEHGRPPGLATLLVGEDPGSAIYVASKQKATAEVGMRGFDHRLAADATREQVVDLIAQLNADPDVSGILCQLPVPDHLDGVELTGLIDARKDVDGLTPVSAGLLALGRDGLRPCTPLGVMLLLAEAGAQLEGAEAVIVGRSNLFGKPMAQLLLGANATVTVCHSRTRDLAAVCRRADVLVAAVGRDRMVKGDWVKPGATVIDVGINRSDDGLHGDVDFDEAAQVAGAITPVPGGVGPMTIACLLRNTLQAARMAVA